MTTIIWYKALIEIAGITDHFRLKQCRTIFQLAKILPDRKVQYTPLYY